MSGDPLDPEVQAAAVEALRQIGQATKDPAFMAHINWGHQHSRMEGYNEGFDEGFAQGIEGRFKGYALCSPEQIAALERMLRDADDWRSSGKSDGYASEADFDLLAALTVKRDDELRGIISGEHDQGAGEVSVQGGAAPEDGLSHAGQLRAG